MGRDQSAKPKDTMFFRFALYGFLKNLRFFEPFIILIFREGGLTFFQIGILYAIRDIAANFLEIPTGIFADIFGRRRSMIMAFLSYLVSFAVFYLYSEFGLLAAAMIFFAFGEAFRSGTHKALILEHLSIQGWEDQKISYYGRTRGASQLGSAVNALIAAGLVFISGNYRYMFLAACVPYVLDLVNMMTYPAELDGDIPGYQEGRFGERARETLNAFFSIFRQDRAMRAILNSASFTAVFKTTKDYIQPILESFALALPVLLVMDDTRRSALIIGGVFFIIYLLTSLASRKAIWFSEQFHSLTQAINVSYIAGAVLLFAAGLASIRNLVGLSILVFIGLYIMQNFRKPMNVANISDQIENRVMASGLSIESEVATLFAALFAPLLGYLADQFSVASALAVFGVGMLVMYLFVQIKQENAALQPNNK